MNLAAETAPPQPWVDPAIGDDDDAAASPPPLQFSLRGLMVFNTVVGILLSIPFLAVGLGFAAFLLLCLMLLQLPLFFLFGAFRKPACDPFNPPVAAI